MRRCRRWNKGGHVYMVPPVLIDRGKNLGLPCSCAPLYRSAVERGERRERERDPLGRCRRCRSRMIAFRCKRSRDLSTPPRLHPPTVRNPIPVPRANSREQ